MPEDRPCVEASGGDVVRAESMLAMADLLQGVLHDLTSPLCAVLAQAEVLRERFPLGRDRTAADRITRAAGRLAALARSYARVAGNAHEEPALVGLNDVIEETLLLFSHSLLSRGVALDRRLSPDLPPLLARPRDVRMLVVALLGPALEAATPRPTARLDLATSSPMARWVRLEVRCPGRRIDAGFEPRVLGAEPDRPSLYLAKCEAERLRGALWVQGDGIRIDLPGRAPATP